MFGIFLFFYSIFQDPFSHKPKKKQLATIDQEEVAAHGRKNPIHVPERNAASVFLSVTERESIQRPFQRCVSIGDAC